MDKVGFGNRPLYFMLLLSDSIGRWPAWLLAPVPVLAAGLLGWLWAALASLPALGWGLGLILLVMTQADYALFALLPRLGLSFGPVAPPWLSMILLRTLASLPALPFLGRWPWPSLVVTAGCQLLGWAAIAYGVLLEPFRLGTTRLEISIPRMANPGGAARIVQIADLHVERLTRRERALPALVAQLAPDLIVLTGDLLNTTYNTDPQAVADLKALLSELYAPAGMYAVWGTEEVDLPPVLRPLFAELGIVLLEDQASAVKVGEHTLWVMGVTCTRDLDAAGAKLRFLVAAAPPQAPKILLFHTPDLMPQAAALGVDLVLSGHTHGGQWRLPGFGAIVTSSRFGKRYESGHVRQGSTHLYVSRGLGMEGYGTPRARFFCPPELVGITLRGDTEQH